MIHCLIIDNDKTTAEIIQNVADDFSEITFNVVDEDYEKALNLVLKDKPQIVFFNIDAVHINISEFLLEINQCVVNQPLFIALSVYKEKAIDAYKYDFIDFLLKPLKEHLVRKSLLKYQKKFPIKQSETICLKSYKDYQYLNIEDILYLKADNNTTDFYMADGRVIGAYKTLKVFENLLPKTFLRIHKSYIINRNCISRIHYGKSICFVKREHKIPFTKTFIKNVDLINTALTKNTLITLN
ncbi:LytR/AlgR family response regulator transcription factor [Psychroserpens luteolus]|uniref:LytR/AlgR family response regulator transcription factor n=1 Tax=Psychroserpens luteolus TaxID=2855840 RepID=UPI001E380DC1|nr:LytTR family DNA-binding domain-containing protein [Psychroserpens luteolus]MCD2258073.1 LytTR family DNA-binding domain-containing protein [Psychroserpens luteolus]